MPKCGQEGQHGPTKALQKLCKRNIRSKKLQWVFAIGLFHVKPMREAKHEGLRRSRMKKHKS